MPPPFITRVRLKNYKSIGSCDVELQSLTFLAGPNGAGKSNFLEAIRFVSDGLRNSLDHAIRERGGINEVRRRSTGHPKNFSIRLDFQILDSQSGFYTFEVGSQPDGGFVVKDEQCSLRSPGGRCDYRVVDGNVVSITSNITPPSARDRLYLVNAAGLPAFRPIYDALSQMGFYNLNPDRISTPQPPGASDLLLRDGSNISSVFAQMSRKEADAKVRTEEFLSKIVPGTRGARRVQLGPMETIEFQQEVVGAANPWRFHALNMSDGTLRAFGVLVALFQFGLTPSPSHRLIGIEEPEAALHPAAAGVLFDALHDASQRIQVIVTSHSPELLSIKRLPVESILAVLSDKGDSQIGPIDPSGRELLRGNLVTAGELLSMDRLRPDQDEINRRRSKQMDFFEALA